VASLNKAHTQISEIVVGKDILELLSSSMYVDPLTIFREYIQNAADAIDEAVTVGHLAGRDDGRIEISLDHITRRVRIRDNGIGVSEHDFARLLTSFGASHKRGTESRGFRGVGRLAGLGYCQELIFRSRASMEAPVLELAWDCKQLKKLLTDSSYEGGLADIVRDVTTLKMVDEPDAPDSFFDVELLRPRRIGKDILLNESVIRAYLAQVAPVPFSSGFTFKDEIQSIFDQLDFELPVYTIVINDEEPICRPFSDSIEYSELKRGHLQDVEPVTVFAQEDDRGSKRKVAAIGWIAHHDYQGAIPTAAGIKGLRARVGNIQIGEDRLFLDVFPEERFNSWTVGELHIIDRRISPNGRRDAFDHSPQLKNLHSQLVPVGAKIARYCRSSSQVRNRLKQFDMGSQKVEETFDIIEQGAIPKRRQQELKREIGAKLQELKRAADFDLLQGRLRESLAERISELEGKFEKLTDRAIAESPIDALPRHKQSVYKEVFDLIYECSQNHTVARILIDKMLARLKTVGEAKEY